MNQLFFFRTQEKRVWNGKVMVASGVFSISNLGCQVVQLFMESWDCLCFSWERMLSHLFKCLYNQMALGYQVGFFPYQVNYSWIVYCTYLYMGFRWQKIIIQWFSTEHPTLEFPTEHSTKKEKTVYHPWKLAAKGPEIHDGFLGRWFFPRFQFLGASKVCDDESSDGWTSFPWGVLSPRLCVCVFIMWFIISSK